MDFPTLIAALEHRAAYQPGRVAFRFLATGEEETALLRYEALQARALSVAAHLAERAAPGSRALLAYAPGLDFVVGFFACLQAGLVAVPVQAPRRSQSFDKLRGIVQDCDARLVLTDAGLHGMLAERLQECGLADGTALVDTAALPFRGLPAPLPAVEPGHLAFLQYTSGSTGAPKGVCVTHAQIVANSRMIARGFGYDRDTVMVSWLPMFHDMGLIGSVIQPVHTGFECVLMPPAAFVQKPMRWLRAIARYGATTAGGPNFGYDLCVQRARDDDLGEVDLSSWVNAYNGAEPVRAATLRAFCERFAPHGFRREALLPCYGLAEATLLVCGAPVRGGARTLRVDADACAQGRVEPVAEDGLAPAADPLAIVSCGVMPEGVDASLRIVDPETRVALPPGRIGEICVAGPHVLAGYWSGDGPAPLGDKAWIDPASGVAHFRTGDLGFEHAGELHVCGRLKDLIIVKGRNLFPQDIEARVESEHEAFERNASAAFTIDVGTEERLVVLQEIRREHRHRLDDAECRARVRAAIAREFDVALHDIVFLPQLSLPKTSSGKIMRRSCRALYLERLAAQTAAPTPG